MEFNHLRITLWLHLEWQQGWLFPIVINWMRNFFLAINRGQVTFTYNIQYGPNVGNFQNNNASYYILLLVISESQKTGWYDGYMSGTSASNSNSVGNGYRNLSKIVVTLNSSGSLCSLPSKFRRQVSGNGQLSYVISPTDESDLYTAMLLQCKSPTSGPQYTFSSFLSTFFSYFIFELLIAINKRCECNNANGERSSNRQWSISVVNRPSNHATAYRRNNHFIFSHVDWTSRTNIHL